MNRNYKIVGQPDSSIRVYVETPNGWKEFGLPRNLRELELRDLAPIWEDLEMKVFKDE